MNNVHLAIQFFIQLAVILLFCRLVGAIALRLGQPQVVAEMLAGVLLGPSLFGLVWPEAQHWLFPWDRTQTVRDTQSYLFPASQLGLALYMFVVGMEFRVDECARIDGADHHQHRAATRHHLGRAFRRAGDHGGGHNTDGFADLRAAGWDGDVSDDGLKSKVQSPDPPGNGARFSVQFLRSRVKPYNTNLPHTKPCEEAVNESNQSHTAAFTDEGLR